uniref:Retinoblastoma-like protein n=1 Tax=Pleodorina starrii TaxID=330485 RepID=N0DU71_9CHLO|nr:retinoblastoma-like protein [Pleodorina starrii]BAN18541.1 retinoblastoma-like protein [Pleodorina starrii]
MVVVMGLLAKKYKDNFNMFLHQLDIYKQVVLKLGWIAFLVLRVKLLSAFPDVVSCVELLPCVFAVLASHAPRLPDCLRHLSQGGEKPALLKAISEMCKADYGRVQARMSSVEALLSQILTTAVPEWRVAVTSAKLRPEPTAATGASARSFSGTLDLVANPVLEGLVTDADRMQRALAALEAEYEQHYTLGGTELDERQFLHTDFTKFASPRFSSGHLHAAMTKLRAGPMPLRQGGLLGPGAHTTASNTSSPHPHITMSLSTGMYSPLPMLHLGMDSGQPNTPVSEVMGASAWLRSVTANLAPEPPPSLLQYFEAVAVPGAGPQSTCPTGPSAAAQQLSRRVRELVSSVMPEEKIPSLLGPFPLLQTSLAAEKRTEVTKLYFHSLENILHVEEKASGMPSAVALLSTGKFHRTLVACCVEVVAACYRMVSCAFPKVLDALHIKAFDLAKMIQGFVKSIPALPRELKRHLFLIEERILESLAWEPGSSLYHHIINHVNRDEGVPLSTAPTLPLPTAATEDTSQRAGDCGAASSQLACQSSGGAVSQAASNCGGTGGKVTAAPNEPAVSGPTPMDTVDVKGASTVAPAPSPSPKRPKACPVFGGMSPAKKARGGNGSPQATQLTTEKLPHSIGVELPGAAKLGGSSGALYNFCHKVLKLAAFRLALMCDNFNFSPLDRVEVSTKVYETIEYALYCQTHLFYNRHIDQIVLSALYGYCKVHKLPQVSFREIITHYRKQPQAQAQQAIFRSVIIEQSNPGLQIVSRADIIAFYNQVFVPAMKSFLLKGEPSVAGAGEHCIASTASGVGAISKKDAPAARAFGGDRTSMLPMQALHERGRSPSVHAISSLATSSFGGLDRLRSKTEAASEVAKYVGGEPAGDGAVSNRSPNGSPHHPSFSDEPTRASQADTGTRVLATLSHTTTAAGTARGAGACTRPAGTLAEHQIPDGLAALLQALDSQQGGVQDGKCSAHEEEALGSGRAIDSQSGDLVQRRSAFRLERREATTDGDAVEDSGNAQSPKSLAGRRQRTPNRRYGTD